MTSTELEIPGYVAGTWTLDPVHTYVGFVIRHMMVSKVRGVFSGVTGELTTAADPEQSTATATIDVTTIDTHNEMRDNHIRSADFFDAENHPTMTFTLTGLRPEGDHYLADGDLTIRGTTRPITLTVEPPQFGPTGQGGTKLGFSASGSVNRHDYGVSYNGPVPGGGSVLGDRVEIVLEVEADLQS